MPRNTHGARSEARVSARATVQKRRLLRQVGLRMSDLDGLGQALLDSWARAQSKVELMDEWSSEHGWLDEKGNAPGFVATYFAALNSARLALGKLGEYLKERPDATPLDVLQATGREIRERAERRLRVVEGGES